jgi:Ni,Fe-hydrogenase I cytochrome b subunit
MKIVYNGTRISEGILLYEYFVHRYYLGVQQCEQKRKVVLSKIVPEEIFKYWKKEKEKEKLYLFIKKEHNFY